MTNPDESDRPATRTWTTVWRIPIAVGTGLSALVCFWAVFDGGTAERWVGTVGLLLLIAWVFVFRALHRRGY
ncbi:MULTISPECIES: hypothetical protein [unclassified Curtobacterium]|uniref:hypothetical protein n=1 Tax=unclassified Curtobacterium TaxID=257496 RepID=UPI0008247E1F|nr:MULTISPECIES: hypothetical protein [unclassified Curtobacterium]WIA98328.1 hypothetical protein QOL16_08065 [Curtobacterium sp. MCBA15_004]WIB01582.1 hypothetical protein QOL15_07815 [Curtobacterium sp. MCBA15_012]